MIVFVKSTILRVCFFKEIQDWIFDPRSYRFVTTKETKNPKMDFFVSGGVVTTPACIACLVGVFKIAASVSLCFQLFEEFLADDLPQEQVLLGADEGALLFLLAAGKLRRKEHVRTKNFYEITVASYIPEDI